MTPAPAPVHVSALDDTFQAAQIEALEDRIHTIDRAITQKTEEIADFPSLDHWDERRRTALQTIATLRGERQQCLSELDQVRSTHAR